MKIRSKVADLVNEVSEKDLKLKNNLELYDDILKRMIVDELFIIP